MIKKNFKFKLKIYLKGWRMWEECKKPALLPSFPIIMFYVPCPCAV